MKLSLILSLSTIISFTQAVFLDTNNVTNIEQNTALIAKGLLDYYEGEKYGGTIGMFSWPYYWWEAGGAWGSLIDYTYYMKNDTLVPLIKQALEYQVGDDYNYIPLNQSTTEGNDDQGFWGIAVMAAAEKNFSNPENPKKAWLSLAQAVFNTMTARWDHKECDGGLRWQIFQWNSGYDYKNSVSNGCLFNIAARLARYTSNDSYVEWAEKVWDWMYGIGLLSEGDWWFVYDGVKVDNNCSKVTKYQWSYNQGLLLSGCAFLYNYTEDVLWLNRSLNLLNGAQVFFANNSVMYEAACQNSNNCNQDQRSFKAFFSRFLGLTSVLIPQTYDIIHSWLVDSANAAASSCSGGLDGHTCGLSWTNGSWDGYYGLGEQMCALEVMTNLRVRDVDPPYTANTGGSSIGDPASGYSTTAVDATPLSLDAGDRAGAGIITAILGSALIGTGVWLVI
ncbi:mannan endo-1,6-alpha-mannosidase [Hyphopichia burtonii NRRL Y-1933]|uniref:Mannan endo-1,6-alpha-mannosidase n=1 Tax=Hyphopichia burtonii NRRL Y-1933 TaxID=984485 RepID=A0A1E4RBW2_9ASCO|nr:mannan endo-1,6-alpha-mannosidase [Hyphopichia burtonii NRRL Y-1933]ODV64713.1 mannan endo-1,6-alpha-mannosidase [Hyphopichia burtonii NRRL Y-1933]